MTYYVVKIVENPCGTETGSYFVDDYLYKKEPFTFATINEAFKKLERLCELHEIKRRKCKCIFEVQEYEA